MTIILMIIASAAIENRPCTSICFPSTKRSPCECSMSAPVETADMLEERLIGSERKIWLQNCPFFYEFVATHVLDWPSLTCQWFPGQTTISNEAVQQNLLLGTHTTGGDQNYLMVATCIVPTDDAKIDLSRYDDECRDVGGFGFVNEEIGTIKITSKIKHEGEVNRYVPCSKMLLLVLNL